MYVCEYSCVNISLIYNKINLTVVYTNEHSQSEHTVCLNHTGTCKVKSDSQYDTGTMQRSIASIRGDAGIDFISIPALRRQC